MTMIMRIAARKVSFVLASALCAAGWAVSAPGAEVAPVEAPSAPAAAPLLQLDEVWVHGKRLADRIEAAEDDFFRLYNALNENDRFDVSCGLMALHAGSMILQRTCIPGFLAARVPVHRRANTYFRPPERMSPPTCYPPVVVQDGAVYYEGGCYGAPMDTAYAMDRYHNDFASPAWAPAAGPIALEALHYREEYAQNVLTVIQSDPRLIEKATHLAALYAELESTQLQYRELKAATPLSWSLRRPGGGPGPRSR